jgi:cold shock CspA family protein
MTGVVTSESTKGFVFVEADNTHQSVFCHISQVKDGRCLHTGDRVSFDVVPNPLRRGTTMAGNVEYLGHVIAGRASTEAVSR